MMNINRNIKILLNIALVCFLFSCSEDGANLPEKPNDFVDAEVGSIGTKTDFDNYFAKDLNQSITFGSKHGCYIDHDTKNLFCWGNNNEGQLGTNDTESKNHKKSLVLTNAQQVSAGDSFTCALNTEGQIYCWGNNSRGQLGVGDYEDRLKPTPINDSSIANKEPYVSLDAGKHHACAVKANGDLVCWGNNSFGQLGGYDISESNIPLLYKHNNDSELFNFELVSAGSNHTCGVNRTGKVLCWGDNTYGQLGVGDIAPRQGLTEIFTSEFLNRFVSVSAGENKTCALHILNFVACWGNNSNGDLGLGQSMQNQYEAVPSKIDVSLTGLKNNFLRVSVGKQHICALHKNKQPVCWGKNHKGNLGRKDLENQYRPNFISLEHIDENEEFFDLVAGVNHSCHYSKDKDIYCSGSNYEGQLGLGFKPNPDYPTVMKFPSINDSVKFKRVEVTNNPTNQHNSICAIDQNDKIRCWGDNSFGQLGTGDKQARNIPTLINHSATFRDIANAGETFCGLSNEHLYPICWGKNDSFQAGHIERSILDRVDTVVNPREIDSVPDEYNRLQILELNKLLGYRDRFYVKTKYNLYNHFTNQLHWSADGYMRWGNYTADDFDNASRQPNHKISTGDIFDISIGETFSSTYNNHSSNNNGWVDYIGHFLLCERSSQLPPNSPFAYRGTEACGDPTNLNTFNTDYSSDFFENVRLFNGYAANCFVYEGKTKCAGRNSFGTVGNSNYDDQAVFVNVVMNNPLDTSDFIKIDSDDTYTNCGIHADGRIFCWGDNYYRTVGLGNNRHIAKLEEINMSHTSLDNNFVDISVNTRHVCGVHYKGDLICWGDGILNSGDYETYAVKAK